MIRAQRPSPAQARNRIGVVLLSLVALATVFSAWALFMRLLASEQDMDSIVREDAMWAVFQTDRHIRDIESLARLTALTGAPRFHEELTRSYDILYSRVSLLDRGSFLLDLNPEDAVAPRAAQLSAYVRGLAPRIDALSPEEPGYTTAVAALAEELRDWVEVSNRLLLDANAGMNALRVGERALRAGIQDQLAWLALVLISAFLGIFALMMVQLRRISRTNRMMALLQERLRRKALRAQAASRAKTTFLATMSHEIRTPLHGIIGSAELLAMAPLSDVQNRQLATLRASSLLLRDLIDGILDFSRLEAGVIEQSLADTDLAAQGALLAAAFEGEAARAGLELSIDLPPCRVRINDSRFRQVLTNLISNALKFTEHGGVRVRGSFVSDTRLRVEVEDDGIGIGAQDLPHLFREFSQIQQTHARRYGGSGLGLAICRRIVEGQGGRIGADSMPGRGSCFWFELPVLLLPETGPEAGTESGTGPAKALVKAMTDAGEGATAAPLDLLVVDDNAVNFQVMEMMLQSLGHRVNRAENGQKALDYLARNAPDGVLMDIQMPVMDGLSATREIRARGLTLPVIGVTANAFSEDRADCLGAGMDDFLPKPVTLDGLNRVLNRMNRPPPPASAPAIKGDRGLGPKAAMDDGDDQLRDLAAALGTGTALDLVTRFEAQLDDLARTLAPLIEEQDGAAQDEVLHSLKGAALTLGMTVSGRQAQALRRALPISAQNLTDLLEAARSDIVQAQRALAELEPQA